MKQMKLLKKMKVKNRLLNFGNMIIYQDDSCFAFSLDSVLLANFVTIKLTDKKIIDFCTGNAPIPMLLSFRTKARIFGVEIQKKIYDMGIDSIYENKLDSQIELVNENVLNLDKIYDFESFDVVTCNPPYFKYNGKSLINDDSSKAIARHEVYIKLEEIMAKARYLLKNDGTFAMVHRPDRMIEIINLMQKYDLEPKKIRFVYPKSDRAANMLLIEGVKNGKSGMKIEKPLIVHDNNGNYVKEVKEMFGSDLNVADKL